jgi:hypothetical protein
MIEVVLGEGATLSDKRKICRLQVDTGALIVISYPVNEPQSTHYMSVAETILPAVTAVSVSPADFSASNHASLSRFGNIRSVAV